jgi:hypothetical protein
MEALARERDLSDNRVLVELIKQGIFARQQKEEAFFQLAERFRSVDDPEQVKQLGDQLGRFVFDDERRTPKHLTPRLTTRHAAYGWVSP